MRKLFITLLVVMCMAPALALADHHEAQEGKEEMATEETAADHMAEMEAWMAANQPGPEHEVLQRMVGDWTWTSTSPMGESSEGTMHAESIFDGRYVLHHWNGSFGEMDFEGHGVDGYDTMKGEYVSGWIDNFSTGVMTSHGECTNDDCSESVSWSKSTGPDGKVHKSKSHMAWDGADSFTMTMYMVPEEGDPVEQMTIVGTRAEGHDHAKMKEAKAEMKAAEAEMADAEAEMAEAEATADEAMAEAAEMEAEAEEAMDEAAAAADEAAAAADEAEAVAEEAAAMMEDDE